MMLEPFDDPEKDTGVVILRPDRCLMILLTTSTAGPLCSVFSLPCKLSFNSSLSERDVNGRHGEEEKILLENKLH